MVSNALPSTRYRKSWSFKRAVNIEFYHLWYLNCRCVLSPGIHSTAVVDAVFRVGWVSVTADHTVVSEGPDIKSVWLKPVPELITSTFKTWVEKAQVEPISIPDGQS